MSIKHFSKLSAPQLNDTDPAGLPRPRTLEQAILLTLAFFDAQDMALTTFEIWQNLIAWPAASYREILRAIQTGALLKNYLCCQDGFYSLRDPEQIRRRQQNIKSCESLFRKGRRAAGWLSAVPFISAVCAVNNLAAGNANRDSDIDFFITTDPGFLWLTRLLATGLVHVLGLRKHGSLHAGRACLSFFAVSTALDFEKFAAAPGDPYLANWICNVAPLYKRPGFDILGSLREANPWIFEVFPRSRLRAVSRRRQVSSGLIAITGLLKKTVEKILRAGTGQFLEKKVRSWQLRHMGKTLPCELKSRTAHVVISDEILKFHEEDRRVWFLEKTIATYQHLLKGQPLAESRSQEKLPGRARSGLFMQPVGETVAAR